MSSDGPTRCPGNYEADMFVTYCEANEDFAEETLNNALSSLGCRLRIQGRDFRPGASTFRDIVEAVQACRRTLVILSPQTVSSKWCMATVNLAAIESSHSSRPVLVFLALGAINASNLGAELLFHIKNSMIFFFPPPENWRNERAMNLFWRRLYNAVR
ncbi:hypothetical protein PoB_004032700 [Plakobranchus ocellatus]|uniref:TIR domain-containing protein n=1 Tax=Plakobranchus ocellatus TaxID=259542 RepID=A0AAV4B2T6_9GAST|nr:hypothetical protein PoB_004032700 [Plakobranchus ocellatus]